MSRCAKLAENDIRLPEAKRTELAQKYADRAIELLVQAVAKGYSDAAHLRNDSFLDPLRQRNDFQKMLAELEAKAKENPTDGK